VTKATQCDTRLHIYEMAFETRAAALIPDVSAAGETASGAEADAMATVPGSHHSDGNL